MCQEKEPQATALDLSDLDTISGGVQAGLAIITEYWDEFHNHHVIDSAGKEHIYLPDGTEITGTTTTKKRPIL